MARCVPRPSPSVTFVSPTGRTGMDDVEKLKPEMMAGGCKWTSYYFFMQFHVALGPLQIITDLPYLVPGQIPTLEPLHACMPTYLPALLHYYHGTHP